MALLSKNKLRFADGTIVAPEKENPLYLYWERCNTMVLSWLLRSVTESTAKSVIWFDNAEEVWKDLESRFSQADSFRISDLQEEIHSFQYGNLSVTDYYTHLKLLWDEFSNLRPMPKCKCVPGCSCDLLQIFKSYCDGDCVIRFLKGLNDSYSTVRSHIMLIDPLPDIKRAFSMVAQHERQINASIQHLINPQAIEPQAFFTRIHPRKNFRQSKRPTCINSGNIGHIEAKCLKKYGFIPNNNTSPNSNQGTNFHNSSPGFNRRNSFNSNNSNFSQRNNFSKKINQVGSNLENSFFEAKIKGNEVETVDNKSGVSIIIEEYAQFMQYRNEQSELKGKAASPHHINTVSTDSGYQHYEDDWFM